MLYPSARDNTDGTRRFGRAAHLSSNLRNHPWKPELFGLPVLHPRCEPAELAVVAVVGEPHLRADEQDASVVNDDATIVDDVAVNDGPARVGVELMLQFAKAN